MNYSPFTNYRTVAVNASFGGVVTTVSKDSMIIFTGTISDTTSSQGYSENGITVPSHVLARNIANDDDETIKEVFFDNYGLVFVSAGQSVTTFGRNGGSSTMTVTGTFRIFELD